MLEQLVHSAWSMIPFGLMLLTIAVAPLLAEKWWESNAHKLIVALILAIPTAICLISGGMAQALEHQVFRDYVPFIVLLLSLYVITGGIHLSGDIEANISANTKTITGCTVRSVLLCTFGYDFSDMLTTSSKRTRQ